MQHRMKIPKTQEGKGFESQEEKMLVQLYLKNSSKTVQLMWTYAFKNFTQGKIFKFLHANPHKESFSSQVTMCMDSVPFSRDSIHIVHPTFSIC